MLAVLPARPVDDGNTPAQLGTTRSSTPKHLHASSVCPTADVLQCRPFTKAEGCRADGWWHPYLKEVPHMAVTLQRLSLQDAHQCLRQCSCLNTCSSSAHASATSSGLVPVFEPALSCLVAVLQGGLLRSRILGISPSRTATVCFALPLKEFLEQVTAGSGNHFLAPVALVHRLAYGSMQVDQLI